MGLLLQFPWKKDNKTNDSATGFYIYEFPWQTPLKAFTDLDEAIDWLEQHSGGVRDCRYIVDQNDRVVYK